MERDTKTHVNSCQTTEVGSPVERVVMFTGGDGKNYYSSFDVSCPKCSGSVVEIRYVLEVKENGNLVTGEVPDEFECSLCKHRFGHKEDYDNKIHNVFSKD